VSSGAHDENLEINLCNMYYKFGISFWF